ncbi:sarcosine oxidase [Plectosphaerella cucumerina]|uniref:Sarcosine oxidase n=1 Tax=Plectosphaerella cucumerina TaxID=40658 RepID=A0A8K0TN21_9PEZI|nr:sarcosine oxidase [Plectosphaerella cucumerina]
MAVISEADPSTIKDAKSIIIVGAGNFGASTALHLAQTSDMQVQLIDTTPRANTRAASHDVNKIVRDDYADELYMKMMLRAMPRWRDSKGMYAPYFHEVGMLRADPGTHGDKVLRAYERLGADSRATWLGIEEVRTRFNGVFADTHFGDLDKIFYNPNCGWAEADKALNAVLGAAKEAGATYIQGSVERVLFDQSGAARGVLLEGGEELEADAVLLATGARTPALLFDSGPHRPDLQVGDRLIATGAMSFTGTLAGAKKEKYTNVPVCKNVLPGVKGESMGMTADGTIKFNCDMAFVNQERDVGGPSKMSVAPKDMAYGTWREDSFSPKFEARALMTMRGLYGRDVDGVEIEKFRMCWDATTPTHDFLITPHPHARRLFLATGGSFHGWKFLPVIGEYISQMLLGTLEKEYAERWAWYKPDGYGNRANTTYDIEFDLPTSGWLDKI